MSQTYLFIADMTKRDNPNQNNKRNKKNISTELAKLHIFTFPVDWDIVDNKTASNNASLSVVTQLRRVN